MRIRFGYGLDSRIYGKSPGVYYEYQMKLTKSTRMGHTRHEYENRAYIRSHKREGNIKVDLKVKRQRMGGVI